MMFSEKTTNPANAILIPEGQYEWVSLTVREIKKGKTSDVDYFDIELIVLEGQYARRKIWAMITSPWDKKIKPEAKEFALMSFTRIFESVGLFIPGNEASYAQIHEESDPVLIGGRITGSTVGIKIGIQAAKDDFIARNTVKEWLSPNPVSKGYKGYCELQNRGTSSHVQNRQMASAAFAPLIHRRTEDEKFMNRGFNPNPELPAQGFLPPSSTPGYANVAQPSAWMGAPDAAHVAAINAAQPSREYFQQPAQQVFVPATMLTPGNN